MNKESIFAPVFGNAWHKMPMVMHLHYANRPHSNDCHIAQGYLDVSCKKFLTFFKGLSHFFGYMPLYNLKNIPVTVSFQSESKSNRLWFKRCFFINSKSYTFETVMKPLKENEVIEILPFNFYWHMYYEWQDPSVVLRHKGYGIRLFGLNIPLPLEFFLGRIHAEERAQDEHTFSMFMAITHPWWGEIYRYQGSFKMVSK